MDLAALAGLLVIAASVWLWLDSLKARDTAVLAVKAASAPRPDRTTAANFLPPFFHSQWKVILPPPSCTVTVARVCASVKLHTSPSTLAR